MSSETYNGNVSTNGTAEIYGLLTGLHYAYPVTMLILAIPANIFLVLATLRHPQSCQNSYHLYITNYGVVNIIQSLVVVTAKIIEGAKKTGSQNFLSCRIYGYLVYSLGCSEVNAYLLITINRYLCVVHPQLCKVVYDSVRNNVLLMLAGWALYPIILLPPLLDVWGHFGFDTHTRTCNLLHNDGYLIFLMCSILLITVPTIVFSYGSILWVFYSTRKKLSHSKPRNGTKLVTAVAVTVLAYFVLYVPFMIMTMVNGIENSVVYSISRYLLNTRLVAQPIVFCAFSPQIRQMLRSKLCISKTGKWHPPKDTRTDTSQHLPTHSL